MARYSPEQLRNARILAAASRRPIIRKAIEEAGLVESSLRDLRTPVDHDSVGVLQQRPSQGWGPAGESVATDAAQFVRAAQKVLAGGFRGSAGELAQAVQRSRFSGRYAARGGEAEALLRSSGGGSSGGGGATVALPDAGGSQGADLSPGADVSGAVAALLSGSRSTAPPISGPAAPAYSARAALPQGYVAPSSGGPAVAQGPDIGALLDAVRTQGGDSPGSGASDAGGGRIQAPGATSAGVAGGKSPLRELFYNGPGGINAKDGQREPRGFVSGHTDHVHVAAGPKTVVKLGRLAEQMGLHVGENPHFGGVNPVHVQGSYHYKGEAIDVSGDAKAMRAFNNRVARIYGIG